MIVRANFETATSKFCVVPENSRRQFFLEEKFSVVQVEARVSARRRAWVDENFGVALP